METSEIITVLKDLISKLEQSESSKFDPDKFIDDIFNNFVRKVDRVRYPDVAFFGFDADGNCLFEYDEKNGVFWASYVRIWSVLEKEMKWKYTDVQKFIKTKVEEHFKLRDVTPFYKHSKRYRSGRGTFQIEGCDTVGVPQPYVAAGRGTFQIEGCDTP